MSYVGRGIIAKFLPEPIKKWLHNLQFKPLRPHTMEPGPAANQKVEGVERIQGYRYPAPASRPPPVVPRVENPDMTFDIKYYSRDVRRAARERTVVLAKKHLTPGDLAEIAEGDAPDRGSSGKFGNPAVKTYDPTGLRSAMSATHEALEAELDLHRPNHMVHYAWEDDVDEILAACKAKGIPPVPGAPFKWKEPAIAKQARW
ncbi:hypothetical protein CTAYLR_005714 [Chrysophaeum taylorii]|uniref:Uncharacterized protein n=1 Tax=Chrysophaeum taylorii TaxID=2483200 RepID=A0AAD7UKJ4_9STRA|nr:hypothetical protein CTAYLR_005714 [Chrysophaeum taylorii]